MKVHLYFRQYFTRFFLFCSLVFLPAFLVCDESAKREELDFVLNHKIVLCTGPSLNKRELLIQTTEHDMTCIPFKKIFLSTNDPQNLDVRFRDRKPVTKLLPKVFEERELGCLNCLISSVQMAVDDSEIDDDDIIIFKHETVYINDMNLLRKAIGKILDGYDIVMRFWLLYPIKKDEPRVGFYHTDAIIMKVFAARKIFHNHPLIESWTRNFKYAEEYVTKFLLPKFQNVFTVPYYHHTHGDSELGFYHIPRLPVYHPPFNKKVWDKANYDSLFEENDAGKQYLWWSEHKRKKQ